MLHACSSDDSADPSTVKSYSGYSLVWSDEFDTDAIDATKWTHETGDGTDYGLPPGWGNKELQLYTTSEENARITSDGKLQITATQTSDGKYHSAKLTTQGTFGFRYGKVEASIKLPKGQGIWPAFWTLGENIDQIDWPGCGEIDIIELVGYQSDAVHHSVHYTDDENKRGTSTVTHSLSSGVFNDSYHVFALDWTPGSLVYSVDGTVTHTIMIEDDMKEFKRSMYLILNMAVGGSWPGDPDGTSIFPNAMYVDYIRVYAQDGLQADAPPVLNLEEETYGQFVDPALAGYSVSENFTDFGDMEIGSFGAGGEPTADESTDAIDGTQSLKLIYPGGNWGGAFFEMTVTKDFSSMSAQSLKFALKADGALIDAEVKLEGPSQKTDAAIYLASYTPADLGSGWVEYSIPMADFAGLDLSEVKIPFSLWNPKTDADAFYAGSILVDDLRIE